MGKLTTHILDTMSGGPAVGVAVRLFTLQGGRRELVNVETNTDGRTNEPLLDASTIQTGSYELEFDIGDYFRGRGANLSEPAFLETVVIRFALIADENFHVPLLCTPWSYSTYRGS